MFSERADIENLEVFLERIPNERIAINGPLGDTFDMEGNLRVIDVLLIFEPPRKTDDVDTDFGIAFRFNFNDPGRVANFPIA